MRTTRKMIEAKFRNVVEFAGGRVATSYNDIGGFQLDHNSVYGGWRIEQITSEGGGVNTITHTRLPGGQFWAALDLFGAMLTAIRRTK